MVLTTVEKVLFKNVMPWLRTDLCATLLQRERERDGEKEKMMRIMKTSVAGIN
jgi:hypothetical protein